MDDPPHPGFKRRAGSPFLEILANQVTALPEDLSGDFGVLGAVEVDAAGLLSGNYSPGGLQRVVWLRSGES